MAKQFELHSLIRGRSALVLGIEVHQRYCHLGSTQPLILIREPANLVDACAVLVTDLLGASCGYVAREHSSIVASNLDAGEVLLARANGVCQCDFRRILIWSEGEEATEVEARFKITRRKKTAPKVLEPTRGKIKIIFGRWKPIKRG